MSGFRLTEEDKADIRRLRAEGQSYDKIGKYIGCHWTTVQEVVHPEYRKRRNRTNGERDKVDRLDPIKGEKIRERHRRYYHERKKKPLSDLSSQDDRH